MYTQFTEVLSILVFTLTMWKYSDYWIIGDLSISLSTVDSIIEFQEILYLIEDNDESVIIPIPILTEYGITTLGYIKTPTTTTVKPICPKYLGVGYMNQKRVTPDRAHVSALSTLSYRAICLY